MRGLDGYIVARFDQGEPLHWWEADLLAASRRLLVNTGRNLTPFHRLNFDPPVGSTGHCEWSMGGSCGLDRRVW